MDPKGDKHGYLRKTGAIPQQRCAVSTKAIAVKGSSRGTGALGAMPDNSASPAKAKLEGNESAHYEKLEKKSLRSLKQGGSEKELRQGHNDFGDIAKMGASGGLSALFGGSSGPSAAELKEQKQRKNVNTVARSGTSVDSAKNPVLAARVARQDALSTARAGGGNVKAARVAANAEVKAAKATRAGFSGAQKKEARQSYKSTLKSARAENKSARMAREKR